MCLGERLQPLCKVRNALGGGILHLTVSHGMVGNYIRLNAMSVPTAIFMERKRCENVCKIPKNRGPVVNSCYTTKHCSSRETSDP